MLPEINFTYALLFFGGAIILLATVLVVIAKLDSAKEPSVSYRKRDTPMSDRERIWFSALVAAIGPEYYVFPQIHFDQLVEPTSTDRKRRFADRARIAQKSVDFVICTRNLRTVLAIEIDDRTHDTYRRVNRDGFVNGLFTEVGLPLVRFRHEDPANTQAILDILGPHLHEVNSN